MPCAARFPAFPRLFPKFLFFHPLCFHTITNYDSRNSFPLLQLQTTIWQPLSIDAITNYPGVYPPHPNRFTGEAAIHLPPIHYPLSTASAPFPILWYEWTEPHISLPTFAKRIDTCHGKHLRG